MRTHGEFLLLLFALTLLTCIYFQVGCLLDDCLVELWRLDRTTALWHCYGESCALEVDTWKVETRSVRFLLPYIVLLRDEDCVRY